MRQRIRFDRRHFLSSAAACGGVLLLAGCSFGRSNGDGDELIAWPAQDRWPSDLAKAPSSVQEAYKYAVVNQDVLQWMPCFCGCGAQGHRSNRDCYVRENRPDGSVLLDPMSFG